MGSKSDFDEPSRGLTREDLLRRAGAGGALLVLPGLFAGEAVAAPERPAGTAVKRGGVFKFARNEEPLSFDPIGPTDNGSIWVIFNIFDQLTTIDRDSTGVVPALAESWTISKDKKSYRFKLRPGVKFSDGTAMTIDDVVASLKRAAAPKINGYAFLYGAVRGINAAGRDTVVVELAYPYAPLLENLSIFGASVVPRDRIGKMAHSPVGTGPFKLQKFTKGQFTRLVRNEHYWLEGKPLLDEVLIRYVPDDNTRILKLQAGEIDAAANIPYAQIDALNRQKGIDVLLEPYFRLDAIWLNNAKKPMTDVSVRQALNYATDKLAIIRSVFFGHAEIANHMLPKMRYWQKDVKPYPYDLDKAKQLIRSSSVPNGFKVTLTIPSGDVIVQQIAQIVKESWGKIGVQAEIQALDIGTMVTNWSKGSYVVGSNWYVTSDVTAPDELAALDLDYWAAGGTHSLFSFFKSKRVSTLVNQAARSTSEAERARLFGQVQAQSMKEAALVTLAFTPARTGIRTYVKDFHTVKTGWWRFENVWLDK